jgi:sRNA-binding protein
MTNHTERNKRGREILAELGRRFPRLFAMEAWEDHRPLALGMDAQLREQCPDIPKEDRLLALRILVGRRQYQVALSTSGAVRFNLDGSEQGAVSAEHARMADSSIKAMDARRLEAAERARAASKAKVSGNGHAAYSPPAEPVSLPPPPPKPLGLAALKAAALARKKAAA